MKVYSVFASINGEVNVNGIGSMTAFVRFAGCSADCPYCDTTYANDPEQGWDMSVDLVMRKLAKLGYNNVTITGGEPLEQRESLYLLLNELTKGNYHVTVETNGQHAFNKAIWSDINWVVDIKKHLPFDHRMYVGMDLEATDYLKMVVGSFPEFKVMLERKRMLQDEGCLATFAFSPEYGKVTPDELLCWMLDEGVGDAVLNFQAHKVLHLSESD